MGGAVGVFMCEKICTYIDRHIYKYMYKIYTHSNTNNHIPRPEPRARQRRQAVQGQERRLQPPLLLLLPLLLFHPHAVVVVVVAAVVAAVGRDGGRGRSGRGGLAYLFLWYLGRGLLWHLVVVNVNDVNKPCYFCIHIIIKYIYVCCIHNSRCK